MADREPPYDPYIPAGGAGGAAGAGGNSAQNGNQRTAALQAVSAHQSRSKQQMPRSNPKLSVDLHATGCLLGHLICSCENENDNLRDMLTLRI